MKSPKTLDEHIEIHTRLSDPNNADEKKMADEMKNAFPKGTKINDLEDIGVWFYYSGATSLILYINEHYRLTINLIGFEFNDKTSAISKELAKKLIVKLSL